jgi:V/A-type H+/Na+-transporting ATPase subunit B
MSHTLVRYSKVVEIVGDLLKVLVPPPVSEQGQRVAFGDLGWSRTRAVSNRWRA